MLPNWPCSPGLKIMDHLPILVEWIVVAHLLIIRQSEHYPVFQLRITEILSHLDSPFLMVRTPVETCCVLLLTEAHIFGSWSSRSVFFPILSSPSLIWLNLSCPVFHLCYLRFLHLFSSRSYPSFSYLGKTWRDCFPDWLFWWIPDWWLFIAFLKAFVIYRSNSPGFQSKQQKGKKKKRYLCVPKAHSSLA